MGRLERADRERMESLAQDVWAETFRMMDGEIGVGAAVAGYIAGETVKAFETAYRTQFEVKDDEYADV